MSHSCYNCPGHKGSFLNVLKSGPLNEIKNHAVPLTVGKGQALVNRYERSHGMACIRSGIVKVHYDSKHADSVIIGVRNSGDAIGHYGIMRDTPIFSAYCVTEVHACFFPKRIIQNQSSKNPELLEKINSLIADDLAEVSNSFAYNVSKPVSQRVAAVMLSLNDKVGISVDNYIAMPITRKELADLVGASIESVFRALDLLKKKGWIEVKNQQIRILNEQKLRLFATVNR